MTTRHCFPFSLSREIPPPYDIYADELRHLHKGYPLYYPEPVDGPVEIADVGFIRKGRFVRLFNASLEASDRHRVPRGFTQLNSGLLSFDQPRHLEPGIYLGRSVARVGSGDELYRFKSSRSAILELKAPTNQKRIAHMGSVISYVKKSCLSWYEFAKGEGYDVSFGEIMIVTEWSRVAAWRSVVFPSSEVGSTFTFGEGGPTTTLFLYRKSKENEPQLSGVQPDGNTEDSLPREPDQTVFMKGLRPGTRELYMCSFYRWCMQAIIRKHSHLNGESSDNRSGNAEKSTSSTAFSSSRSTKQQLMCNISSAALPDFHPGIALLAYRMEMTDEEIIIINDDEWCDPDNEAICQIIDKFASFLLNGEVLLETTGKHLHHAASDLTSRYNQQILWSSVANLPQWIAWNMKNQILPQGSLEFISMVICLPGKNWNLDKATLRHLSYHTKKRYGRKPALSLDGFHIGLKFEMILDNSFLATDLLHALGCPVKTVSRARKDVLEFSEFVVLSVGEVWLALREVHGEARHSMG